MPPRIPLFQCLKAPNVSPYSRPFTTSSPVRASTKTQRRRHQDPYAVAQAKAKRAANLSRQEVLKKERAEALGDPVRGKTTPFVESFDAPTAEDLAIPLPKAPATESTEQPDTPRKPDGRLNFFLSQSELDAGIQHSKWLLTPPDVLDEKSVENYTSDFTPEERRKQLEEEQANADEALRRITNMSLSSSKDRLRVNIQRSISTFGRHNTDSTLPQRPSVTTKASSKKLPPTPRVGPDTGSSEVQIAILTAKIRTLADFLETRGKMDKHNKRNLRLLVHRRAKLCKYLRRKEMGGPRWQHAVEQLGITDGMWKGEITIMGALGGHAPERLKKLLARETFER